MPDGRKTTSIIGMIWRLSLTILGSVIAVILAVELIKAYWTIFIILALIVITVTIIRWWTVGRTGWD